MAFNSESLPTTSFSNLITQDSSIRTIVHPWPINNLFREHLRLPREVDGFNQNFQLTAESMQMTSTLPTIRQKIQMLVVKSNKNNKKNADYSFQQNCQSSIVNQIYSFFSNSQASQKIVERAIKCLKIKNSNETKIIFYNLIRLINIKRSRKYHSVNNLLDYLSPQKCQKLLPNISSRLKDLNSINFDSFCWLFRVCVWQFVNNSSTLAILTSKKIVNKEKILYLRRLRTMLKQLSQTIN